MPSLELGSWGHRCHLPTCWHRSHEGVLLGLPPDPPLALLRLLCTCFVGNRGRGFSQDSGKGVGVVWGGASHDLLKPPTGKTHCRLQDPAVTSGTECVAGHPGCASRAPAQKVSPLLTCRGSQVLEGAQPTARCAHPSVPWAHVVLCPPGSLQWVHPWPFLKFWFRTRALGFLVVLELPASRKFQASLCCVRGAGVFHPHPKPSAGCLLLGQTLTSLSGKGRSRQVPPGGWQLGAGGKGLRVGWEQQVAAATDGVAVGPGAEGLPPSFPSSTHTNA